MARNFSLVCLIGVFLSPAPVVGDECSIRLAFIAFSNEGYPKVAVTIGDTNGCFQLFQVAIQSSDDLEIWETRIQWCYPDGYSRTFTDTTATNRTSRFYRAVRYNLGCS
jgi:hypothetical protein